MAAPEFDALWEEAIADVDEAFGEDFDLEPRGRATVGGRPDVNARSVPAGSDRPVATFRATYKAVGTVQNAKGRSMADNTTMPIAADSPMLRLTIPGEGFARPQTGDYVTRQATGERFRVAVVLERRQGSLAVQLARIGAAP